MYPLINLYLHFWGQAGLMVVAACRANGGGDL